MYCYPYVFDLQWSVQVTYVHIHTCIQHTYIYTCIHTHTHMHTYIHIHTCIHTYTHAYTYAYMHTYIHIHTYIHTYTHAYTCIHTYIHTCNDMVAVVLQVVWDVNYWHKFRTLYRCRQIEQENSNL